MRLDENIQRIQSMMHSHRWIGAFVVECRSGTANGEASQWGQCAPPDQESCCTSRCFDAKGPRFKNRYGSVATCTSESAARNTCSSIRAFLSATHNQHISDQLSSPLDVTMSTEAV